MITTQTIFWTQMASLIAFVVALFVLYRLLVSQKDATIELQKENISFLKSQLDEAKSQTPDALAQSLGARIKLVQEELRRYEQDKSITQEQVKAKEAELFRIRQLVDEQKKTIIRARRLIDPIHCPYCRADLVISTSHRDWPDDTPSNADHEKANSNVESRRGAPPPLIVPFGHEYYSYHEHTVFDCGYEIDDGEVKRECKNHRQESNIT